MWCPQRLGLAMYHFISDLNDGMTSMLIKCECGTKMENRRRRAFSLITEGC